MRKEYATPTSPNIQGFYYDTFWSKTHYPALEIAYLAVGTEYQRQGIGSEIIELIVPKAKSQNLGGCQFVTVEAYQTKDYSAVGFYRKNGFACADIVAKYDTIRMYRNLLE